MTSRLEQIQQLSLTEVEIQAWLVSYLSRALDIDPSEMDITVTFERYGLDSLTAVGMTSDLEDWLGHEIDPTLPFTYPTIAALAECLAKS